MARARTRLRRLTMRSAYWLALTALPFAGCTCGGVGGPHPLPPDFGGVAGLSDAPAVDAGVGSAGTGVVSAGGSGGFSDGGGSDARDSGLGLPDADGAAMDNDDSGAVAP
jgi:hypothetical protein